VRGVRRCSDTIPVKFRPILGFQCKLQTSVSSPYAIAHHPLKIATSSRRESISLSGFEPDDRRYRMSINAKKNANAKDVSAKNAPPN
tara:strand:- start:221 stop:481 length:261 start_codon:yes stop_codon:yes gene_type:complete